MLSLRRYDALPLHISPGAFRQATPFADLLPESFRQPFSFDVALLSPLRFSAPLRRGFATPFAAACRYATEAAARLYDTARRLPPKLPPFSPFSLAEAALPHFAAAAFAIR